MSKLRIMSDLHLEFGPLDLEPVGEDVLVLAGDIGTYADGAEWAADYAKRHSIPAVMIAGNHEFYQVRWGERRPRPLDYTINDTLAAIREIAASEPLLTFLEDDSAEVSGVVFVGCTLWTDFALDGIAEQHAAMARALHFMNDYNLIYEDAGRFQPAHALSRHEASVAALRRLLWQERSGKPVVVLTHHLPSPRSIAGRYANSDYNAAYASRLDNLVASSGAALWVHGHTHVSQDYRIGDIRIICNPRGYDGYELNPEFDPALIVDVPEGCAA